MVEDLNDRNKNSEDEFEASLKNKFSLLKQLITKAVREKNPALVFALEEGKRIVTYASQTYFKHLRLYEFVFNNKAPSKLKRIVFN